MSKRTIISTRPNTKEEMDVTKRFLESAIFEAAVKASNERIRQLMREGYDEDMLRDAAVRADNLLKVLHEDLADFEEPRHFFGPPEEIFREVVTYVGDEDLDQLEEETCKTCRMDQSDCRCE